MQAFMPVETLDEDVLEWCAAEAPAKREEMEASAHCAYNRTRECFLGLGVEVADLPYPALAARMQSLTRQSGKGLWITPYRGVPASGLSAPLDLIYLDEDCRVLDLVESFPTFQISPAGPKPSSVLALPAHSIFSSQTQAGDQLLVCRAEEMEARLEGLASGKNPITVQSAVLLREEPLWSGGPGIVELQTPPAAAAAGKEHRHQMSLAKPEAKPQRAPRSWLERWWSPDPRRAPREPAPGLAAYYWNGSAPEAHGIKDISSTGMYVVTEERWYPGTLVLMTLQRIEGAEEAAERSISVLSRAVRWGQDGVGLQFILADPKEKRKGSLPAMETAERKDFERFLQQLKKSDADAASPASLGAGKNGAGEGKP